MPTDPALCKRLANGVMGWTLDGQEYLDSAHARTGYGLSTLSALHRTWHPDTDIAQSKMLLDKIGERFDWTISYHQESKEYCVELFFPGHYRKVAYESLHKVLEMAICNALNTVLSEDKK